MDWIDTKFNLKYNYNIITALNLTSSCRANSDSITFVSLLSTVSSNSLLHTFNWAIFNTYKAKIDSITVEDESIFIHDALIRRRMWTPEGIRPIVTVTGSHQRTCVFGTITIDGKQLFRQYDVFNQYVFLKYLKELQRKFRKLLLFIDRAVQHRSSIMVRKHLEENKDVIRVEYLPKG